MDLRERLDGYEVTAVPRRGALQLVWSLPADSEVDLTDAATADDAGACTASLALLSDYRITLVPARRAAS